MKNKYFILIAIAFLGTTLFGQTTVWVAEGDDAKWNVVENWRDGLYPDATVKTVFNVPASANCLVDVDSAVVKHLVMGDNADNGGSLIIKDGGVLTLSADGPWSAVGYNASCEMIIEADGVVEANQRFHVGLVATAAGEAKTAILEVAGTLNGNVNQFTVNDPGLPEWTAECYVTTGGVINTPGFYIGDGGLVDVTGGWIYMAGDMRATLEEYVNAGKLTAEGGDEAPTIELMIVDQDTSTVVKSSTSVGVEPAKAAISTISVYPNPATDVVYFSDGVIANVEVYSIARQMVLRKEQVSQVNVSDLKAGIYFIKAATKEAEFVEKFIKE